VTDVTDPRAPEAVRQTIYGAVRADLEPRPLVVHAKIAAGVGVGGMISLFLCGQLGIGLSGSASAAHAWIMERGGMLGCAVVCGVIFALAPVAMLRLLCSTLQFRAILHRETRALVLWIAVFGLGLALRNDYANPLWELTAWCVAAVASFLLLARLVDRTLARALTRAHRLRA
jgi:hypothetical protein